MPGPTVAGIGSMQGSHRRIPHACRTQSYEDGTTRPVRCGTAIRVRTRGTVDPDHTQPETVLNFMAKQDCSEGADG